MPREIEKKYLVRGEPWTGLDGKCLRQAYLSTEGKATVRVRICGELAWLTIKGRPAEGSFDRLECEYPVPADEAGKIDGVADFINNAGTGELIEHFAGFEWVIDVFKGDNEGLVLAEIELPSEDTSFDLPPWAGQDVTFDHRFSNSALSKSPWKNFREEFLRG